MRAVADGGVGAGLVDGDREGGAAARLGDAPRELLLLGEPGGDEQVEQQVAARAPFAHHEVPQQAAVAVARERPQSEVAARLRHGHAGAVHALGGQQAVDDVDDLLPGPALVQPEDQPSVFLLAERELHLVAVAPRVVHAADGLQLVLGEVRDALQGVHHLLLLELQLRRVVQRLPLAAAALLRVAAARRDAAGRGSDDLEGLRLGVRLAPLGHAREHVVAGYRSAHEHDELVQARDALPAVGERGDVELDGVSGAWWHGRPVYLPRVSAANRPGGRCCQACRPPRRAIVHPVDGSEGVSPPAAAGRVAAGPSGPPPARERSLW